ncbi:MAG: sbcD [Proteobacteria bacterium]|nr:sbcD [Pseudomonadota bacterium]
MRLLHTSDWHLGQTLHDFERTGEHRRFLDWLAATLEAQAVDALLVSGDVFDTANPPAAAQALLYRFLREAKARVPHLGIVIVAGNHDSPARLEAPAPLLQAFDACVVGQPRRGADGEAVPYLRPGDVPRVETEGDAFAAGVAELYRQAYAHAASLRQPGQAIVAMGHCHMSGGQVSELSERRLVVGGAEALPADLFDAGIAYVALGHLHLAQRVGGRDDRRYAGSPLPMSFAEVDYPHQAVCVELDGERLQQVRSLRVPRFLDLLRVPEAAPAPVAEVLDALRSLNLPERPRDEQPLLQVRVRLDAPEPGLRASVEAAIAGKPLRLARIETSYPGRAADAVPGDAEAFEDLGRLAPEDIFRRVYERQFQGPPPAALLAAFAELLHEPEGAA